MPEIGNTAVWKQTDADNTTGTQPSWSGSASPDTIDNAGRAMMGAITREWNWRNFTVTTTGAANALVLTYSVAPAALYDGQEFGFITNHALTGATTLNINSLGAKALEKDVGGTLTAIASGDAPAGVYMKVAYKSGVDKFVWVNRGQIPSSYYSPGGTDVALADGGTGASLADPNADRIMFWDDSAGAVTWLTAGSGLAITTTTMAVDINGLTEDTSPDLANDFVMTYDTSAAALKKVKPNNLEPAATGGFTSLGTITTTSGVSQNLGSLTLTSYKFLRLVWNGVGHNNGTPTFFLIGNSTSDDVQCTVAEAGGAQIKGIMDIDLATGIGSFAYQTAAGTYASSAFDSALSPASTAVSIATNAGSLDDGSVVVYGIS